MNKLIMSGNLIADAELLTSASGVLRCQFTISCPRIRSKKADLYTVVIYNDNFDKAKKYAADLKKGMKVTFDGCLQKSDYEQNGVRRSNIDVIADWVEYPPKRKAESG